jgi:hypothetical protein
MFFVSSLHISIYGWSSKWLLGEAKMDPGGIIFRSVEPAALHFGFKEADGKSAFKYAD